MNIMKKVAAVCLLGLLALVLGACNPTRTTVQSPEETASGAAKKLADAKSINSTMHFDAKVLTGEESSEATNDTTIEMISQPFSVGIVGTNKSQDEITTEIKTYAMEENGVLVSYAAYGNQWIKQNVDKEGFLSSIRMYDTKTNLTAFLEKATDIAEVSRENRVITMESFVPESDFKNLAESAQLFQMLGLSGLPEEYFKGVGDLKITFTIDEQTGAPLGYNLDLSDAAQTMMNNVNHYLAGASTDEEQPVVSTVTIERFIVDVKINSIDKTEKITIPKEAIESAVDVAEQMKMNEQEQNSQAAGVSKVEQPAAAEASQ